MSLIIETPGFDRSGVALVSHMVEVGVENVLLSHNLRAEVVGRARSALLNAIQSGRASPFYRVFVDGVENAPEESVRIPGGRIEYRFSRLAEATTFAYLQAITWSPPGEKEPHYAESWFVMVNRVPWTHPISEIPPGVEVAISNLRPYHRKIDVGGQITSVPPQIVERVRQKVAGLYSEIDATRTFLTWPGAYILKGFSIRSGLSYDFKKKRFIRLHPPRRVSRAGSRAGDVMTYPTLILREKEV